MEVAMEIDFQLEAIQSKIASGKAHPKSIAGYTEYVKSREEAVLCPDSTFVSIYNAHIGIICGHWMAYQLDATTSNAGPLQGAIEELQLFVKNYHQKGIKEPYRWVNQPQPFLTKIDKLLFEIGRWKKENISHSLTITLNNVESKLKYLQRQGMQINQSRDKALASSQQVKELGDAWHRLIDFLRADPFAQQFRVYERLSPHL